MATFTVIVIEALETMGIVVSEAEREAYLHTWLVVGHLLGIDYGLLRRGTFKKTLEPLTYFEMQLVSDSIFRRQAAPSPSGQILTRCADHHAGERAAARAAPVAARGDPPFHR